MTEMLLKALRTRGWTVTVAESCTGGMVAAALTDIAGSSEVFERGFITYSNAAKQDMLGVTEKSLEAFGAVSEPVAREMAAGALIAARADVAVAITGIAGPGGSDVKPEGRVCFALATAASLAPVHTETVEFGARGRAKVRAAARDHALALVLKAAQP